MLPKELKSIAEDVAKVIIQYSLDETDYSLAEDVEYEFYTILGDMVHAFVAEIRNNINDLMK